MQQPPRNVPETTEKWMDALLLMMLYQHEAPATGSGVSPARLTSYLESHSSFR